MPTSLRHILSRLQRTHRQSLLVISKDKCISSNHSDYEHKSSKPFTRIQSQAIPWAVTRWARAKWAARWPGRLLERGRHNLRWQVEVVAEVLNAVIGEVPVVVLPGEGLPDIFLGLKALHELDHLQVRHIDLRVLRQVVVLLGVQHTLCNMTYNSDADLLELKLATVYNNQVSERYFN
jgi:hypothetical protein